MCIVHIKLWDPLRTRGIPERLRGVFTTRCYTNTNFLEENSRIVSSSPGCCTIGCCSFRVCCIDAVVNYSLTICAFFRVVLVVAWKIVFWSEGTPEFHSATPLVMCTDGICRRTIVGVERRSRPPGTCYYVSDVSVVTNQQHSAKSDTLRYVYLILWSLWEPEILCELGNFGSVAYGAVQIKF